MEKEIQISDKTISGTLGRLTDPIKKLEATYKYNEHQYIINDVMDDFCDYIKPEQKESVSQAAISGLLKSLYYHNPKRDGNLDHFSTAYVKYCIKDTLGLNKRKDYTVSTPGATTTDAEVEV